MMDKANLKKEYDNWHSKIYQTDLSQIKPVTYKFYEWILKLLNPKRGGKILDMACGKGLFLSVAKTKGLEISGVDLSQVAIDKANEVVGGNFVCGDCENMPYKNESFDYVTCLGSLEHFPDPERGAREIVRVLKSNGTACVYVPNKFFLGHIFMTMLYGIEPSEGMQEFSEVFYTRVGWQELLERNGLKVQKVYKYNNVSGTKKVNKLIVFIWNYIVAYLIPFNLSYAFVYIVKKK